MLIVIITAAKLRGQIGWSKDQEITDAICDALKKNFVFKGIPENLLLEVRGACMHGRDPMHCRGACGTAHQR